MKPNLIVWDLETVPDLGGFAAANDLAPDQGGLLDGAMEKEVSNGSRHGPLPERIR
jgi:hypothetical protein